jgi:manganese transport protein
MNPRVGAEQRRAAPRFTLLGPAMVAAVAYVDPGNVATNTSAGSRYGYLLLWVLVLATVVAGVMQYLSAALGAATGQSLPELVGQRLGSRARTGYWLQAELIAMATDVAEVVGGAVALRLLFDWPLPVGGVVTGLISLALLMIRDRGGLGRFELVILGLLVVIAAGFGAGLIASPPSGTQILHGLVPAFDGIGTVVLAAGMVGATVMPHALYVHSALAADRFRQDGADLDLAAKLRVTRYDVVLAMILAGAVNISMLLVAATALGGSAGVDTLEGAHAALSSRLGPFVALAFAVALLVSGLSSTAVGSHAGAVVMAGLAPWQVGRTTRRLITMVPAIVLLATGIEPTGLLVGSQVLLCLGIPLVMVPLVRLAMKSELMGPAAAKGALLVFAWAATAVIAALDLVLVVLTVTESG